MIRGCFLFIALVIVVGGIFTCMASIPSATKYESAALQSGTTPAVATQTPSVAAVTTPVAPAAPVVVPTPGPDSPRGATTSFTKDSVTIDFRPITGISSATAAPNNEVSLVYSTGIKHVSAASLPQGFLDAWGITPDSLRDANQKAAANRDQADADAASEQQKDASSRLSDLLDQTHHEMTIHVVQVLNGSEVLGMVGDAFKMVHLSGIDTSNLAQGDNYTFDVWPVGVYQYTSQIGPSQIESFTASRDAAAAYASDQ